MKLSDFKTLLAQNSDLKVRFRLPDQTFIAAHAHVTEVARIDKRYIDCGGTLRQDSYCRLQTWVADDIDHRLNAKKLFGILNKAESFLGEEDLELDVEHELSNITQFPIESCQVLAEEFIVNLSLRHTACLAPEKCLPAEEKTLVSLQKKIREE
jgi:hypothetical protein